MTVRATPYRSTRTKWTFTMTPFRTVLLAILALFFGLVAYRFVNGIGAPTNLTDRWPWALWTSWKLTGVALAGAGYSTALCVHFLGRGRWHDIERGAFVLSLLGYLMVCTALILDLGQWYNAWHPVVYWGYHSVMFELFWCIGTYTVVQVVEFFYIFEERVHIPVFAQKVLKKIYVPLLFLGAILPVFHQSALCSLYVLAKGRLDPLWWSMLLPLFAVMTSFYVGPSVVAWENFVANRTYGRPVHMRVLGEMVRISALIMFVYFALRIGDYAVRGVLPELFSGTLLGNVALIELGACVLLPALMFMTPSVRMSRNGMRVASGLTIAGVVLNRFNITILGMMASTGEGFYVPHWMEVGFVLGLAAGVALVYLFLVENFPVYSEADVLASEAAFAEARAEARARSAEPAPIGPAPVPGRSLVRSGQRGE
jgi:Ni/Fe-hydrogenase subunit HybB-like protein